MWKNIFKLVFFVAWVSGAIFAIIVWTPIAENNYFKASILKHLFLRSAPSPKVIFIGGSNLAFGLDSGLIRQAIGRPVINMGLHNGLGLQYMMNEVRDSIRTGDMVVIVPEYNFVLEGSQILLEQLIVVPSTLRYFDFNQYIVMLKKFPVTLQMRFNEAMQLFLFNIPVQEPDSYHNRKSFNKYGDLVGHLSANNVPLRYQLGTIPVSVPKILKALNLFNRELRARGATFLLSYPPVPASYLSESNRLNIRALHRMLLSQGEFKVLGQPEDFVYPEECFFNTIYHLNRTGRELRTRKLIDLLLGELQGQGAR